ncbi:hypothetical protein CAPTEDRAFT_208743 [Capitella teleta]|uniref:Endonuclease/exonuclease/phosphatase domain-containing protein n=1 Tax=Capitella teleta TaxID=283909 RepID=R7VLZ8_CAPTE|nr:hypothetical protein CAPTEDRAFT_208743 [Capitella teleta]|eukprot:ELU18075.1 hypothetical protein CAPTEDRAFT_208743 [Capitella teleta]
MALRNLRIISFNCESVRRCTPYLQDTLESLKCDIVCLQETWLIQSNEHFLGLSDIYFYIHKPGVDQEADVLQGRPKGGTAFMYNKLTRTYSVLIINVYMPCDNYSGHNVLPEYDDVLDAIEQTFSSNAGSSCNDFVICGDFNTSFERFNAHSRLLSDFLDFNNLKLCWRSNSAQLHVDFVQSRSDDAPSQQSMKRRRWRWATDDHIDAYKRQLDQELVTDWSQGGAFACNNSSCSDEQHHGDVTKLCDNIIQSCLSSSEKTIPSRRARRPPIAGWKEHVKPY